MNDFLTAHGLFVANAAAELAWKDEWTFRSAMQVERRIDFIFLPFSVRLLRSRAVLAIDLGSDHRAVEATFQRSVGGARRKIKKISLKGWKPFGDGTDYRSAMGNRLDACQPSNIFDIERVIFDAASNFGSKKARTQEHNFWHQDSFQALLVQRRMCRNAAERRTLSFAIRNAVRQELRRRKSEHVGKILQEFEDLSRMTEIRSFPVRDQRVSGKGEIESVDLAKFLADIFSTDSIFSQGSLAEYMREQSQSRGEHVERFTQIELERAIRAMKNRRCGDESGIVAEMFKNASDKLLNCLLQIFNEMLQTGVLEPSWRHTLFKMLPKSGDLQQASNWRPIAILRITYKIFSRLINHRLRSALESRQAADQVGFRRGYSVDDAFVVLDSICGKTLEWQLPLWCASLDLRKAFDRIEYAPLFEALRAQGVEQKYIALLAQIYSEQDGRINGAPVFQIQRGVKQGDVISPLLFNAGLELAISRWKRSLGDRGLQVGSNELLTNVRYADDLMLYATSWQELCNMIESLISELSRVGLQLNTAKTKIFTNSDLQKPLYTDIAGGMVEVLVDTRTHMYLGRKLPANPRERTGCELSHRVQAAWHKFQKHREALVDQNISIRSRLRLFQSVVAPSMLFGLAACALTAQQMSSLDAIQNRMLRIIVGWVRFDGEGWDVTMRRMAERVAVPIEAWSVQLLRRQFRLAARVASDPSGWSPKVSMWRPAETHMTRRKQGRPLLLLSAGQFSRIVSCYWLGDIIV